MHNMDKMKVSNMVRNDCIKLVTVAKLKFGRYPIITDILEKSTNRMYNCKYKLFYKLFSFNGCLIIILCI